MDWRLWHSWSNPNAYLAGCFPLKASLVCLVTGVVPLFAALIVFRRKVYEGHLVAVVVL